MQKINDVRNKTYIYIQSHIVVICSNTSGPLPYCNYQCCCFTFGAFHRLHNLFVSLIFLCKNIFLQWAGCIQHIICLLRVKWSMKKSPVENVLLKSGRPCQMETQSQLLVEDLHKHCKGSIQAVLQLVVQEGVSDLLVKAVWTVLSSQSMLRVEG